MVEVLDARERQYKTKTKRDSRSSLPTQNSDLRHDLAHRHFEDNHFTSSSSLPNESEFPEISPGNSPTVSTSYKSLKNGWGPSFADISRRNSSGTAVVTTGYAGDDAAGGGDDGMWKLDLSGCDDGLECDVSLYDDGGGVSSAGGRKGKRGKKGKGYVLVSNSGGRRGR